MADQLKQTTRLTGRGLSPGTGRGRAFVVAEGQTGAPSPYEIAAHEVAAEFARIEQAIAGVRRDLQTSAERVEQQLDTRMAEIFRAHDAMLQDPALAQEIRTELEEQLVNAEHALSRVLRRWERRLRAQEKEAARRTADDIADLSRRLQRHMSGVKVTTLEQTPPGSVIVARRLLPSDTVGLPRENVHAIVLEQGSRGSHAALLARALDIPVVSQIANALPMIAAGDELLVDGEAGTVIVAPTPADVEEFEARTHHRQVQLGAARQRSHEPARTADGQSVRVLANVGCRKDVELTFANGADGIGLYRIEQLYLRRHVPPSEEELLRELGAAIAPIRERPVTIRLLDVGGDKALPFLALPAADNPLLGRRGVRLLLAFPDLAELQLRVLVQLARDHNARILVPLVTVPDDMARLRAMLGTVAAQMGARQLPPLGAMIETPAAALGAAEIVPHADFLSLGTNDLTQYTMAASREDPLVNDYFCDDHPVILRLVQLVLAAAGDRPVELCGELAGNLAALPSLLQLGLRAFSVAPPLVPVIKETIRHTPAGNRTT